MTTPYDSTEDTKAHIHRVQQLITEIILNFHDRLERHDLSKLESPEKEIFDEFTPKLKGSTYGSPEYKEFLAGMKPALDHHYEHNRHHPEHGEPGLEWRPVKDFEGLYEVSNYGDVRSLARVVKREGLQGDLSVREREMAVFRTPKGYFRVQLQKDADGKNFMVHRLVASAFIPNPDEKPEVNHRNGNKEDNRAANLEWVTESENQQHAYGTGLKEPAVKYVVHCLELDLTTFGTQAMEREVRSRGYIKVSSAGIWSAMDRGGKHFDLTFEGTLLAEWHRNRLANMTLLDLLEMLADWKAAGERHANGSLERSFTVNGPRFNIPTELEVILKNTAHELHWLP